MNGNRVYRFTLFVVAGLIVSSMAFVPACLDKTVVEVVSATLDFNDRIRPDHAPLGDGQKDEPRAMFSDGSDGARADGGLISELYPSELQRDALQRLRSSETLWIPDPEGNTDRNFTLSYEVVVRDLNTRGPDMTLTNSLTDFRDSGEPAIALSWHPRVGLSEPVERRLPILNGSVANIPTAALISNFDVGLIRCTSNPPPINADNLSQPLSEGCRTKLVSPPVCQRAFSGINEYFPFTVLRCPIRINEDTTLYLQASGPSNFGNYEYVKYTVRPHIKVVRRNEIRSLARPMTKIPTDDGDRDFVFQVPEDARGERIEDNFSPELAISHIRFFRRPPGEGPTFKHYLSPDQVRGFRFDFVDCDFSTLGLPPSGTHQIAIIDMISGCPGDERVTPAYRHADRSAERVKWLLSTSDDDLMENLFIEFFITQVPTVSLRGLRIEPPVLQLGSSQQGAARQVQSAFRIINEGSVTAAVESLTVGGSDAASFAIDSPTTPFALQVGGVREIDLTFTPPALGLQRATIRVGASDVAGSGAVSAEITGYSVSPHFTLLPTEWTRFERPGAGPSSYEWAFELGNGGGISLRLGDIRIVGSDAAAFSIRGGQCLSPSSLMPRDPARQLDPGEFECIKVVYNPTSEGTHNANLVVDSDAGSLISVLSGQCTGACSF